MLPVILLTALSAAALAWLLTPLVRDAALRRELGMRGNSARGVHTRPIPRLGGVAIVVATAAPMLGLPLLDPKARLAVLEHGSLSVALLLGGLVIAALGVYDDLKGARARHKLAVQVAVACGMYAAGFRIDEITNPFGGTIALGWIGLPFTVLWIAGVVNAMNLVDGLDGLAGGVAFFAVLTTLVVALVSGDLLMATCAAAMAGAVLGFLRYNFNPATVFMGDTGSMFLGFVLAVTAIHAHEKTSAVVGLAVPVLALGVPIADTLLSMGRRALRGRPIFSPDKGHIHHRLLDRGLSHRQAVLVLYASASVLGAAALALAFVTAKQAAMVLTALAFFGFIGLRALGFFDLAKTGEILASRRRNLAMRFASGEAEERLRAVRTPEDLQATLLDFAAGIGAAAVALAGPVAERADAAFSVGFDAPDDEMLRATFPACGPGALLELGWRDGRAAVDRETHVVVIQLCEVLADALERFTERELAAAAAAAATSAWRA